MALQISAREQTLERFLSLPERPMGERAEEYPLVDRAEITWQDDSTTLCYVSGVAQKQLVHSSSSRVIGMNEVLTGKVRYDDITTIKHYRVLE